MTQAHDRGPRGDGSGRPPEATSRRRRAFAERAQSIAKIGYWRADRERNGRLLWSAELLEIFGIRPEDFDARVETFYRHVHPDDRARVEDAERASFDRGAPYALDFRIVREDGEVRWLHSRADVIEEDGRKAWDFGVMQDITERKRAEERLRETAEQLETLIDYAPEAILIFDVETGHFVRTNQQAEELFGLPRGELLELAPWDVSPLLQPDGRRSEDVLLQLIDAALAGEHVSVEWVVSGARGEITCELRLVRLPSASGQKLIRSSITDVSERQRAQRALQESEARTRAIVETSVDGIITIDEHGIVETMNAAAERLFGYTAEEVIGRNVSMLMPEPDRGQHASHMEEYRRTGVRRIIGRAREVRGLRQSGARFPLEIDVSEVELAGRRVFTAIMRDVSDRKRLEEQLLQSQKMESIGRLAGGVAHDFNNLLTAIIGNVDLALTEIAEGPVREDLMEVRSTAERAASLTGQLLSFSRRQLIEPRLVDLNELLARTERLLRRVTGEDIDLHTALTPGLGKVLIDPGQFEQVLLNLAVNARDAMPVGGRLTIETENVDLDEAYASMHPNVSPGPHVMLSVADEGEGMPEEVQQHIFEPFFTTKPTGKGTGLGLATVYGIVTQAGGHIYVYSEPGGGTVFRILLPRAEEDDELTQSAQPAAQPEPRRGKETVLLAEDEPPVRKLAARILRSLGYTIIEAADGMDAARIASEYGGPIDLLMTDIVMPNMGGKELSESLRRSRPDVRVLFTSGYTDDVVFRQGMLEAGVPFLQKPFTAAGLAQKIREVLDAPPE